MSGRAQGQTVHQEPVPSPVCTIKDSRGALRSHHVTKYRMTPLQSDLGLEIHLKETVQGGIQGPHQETREASGRLP